MAKIMRSWHRCIKKAIDDGYLPPQEISGKLFLEMQGPAGFGYLDTVAQRIENDLGTLPESILLDEFQIWSVGEVVSLLLLTRIGSDEANRIILVGDQFQSLNGNRFTWDTWLNDFGSL